MTRSHSLHYSCFSLSLSPALGFLYTDSVAIFLIGLELETSTHPGQGISFVFLLFFFFLSFFLSFFFVFTSLSFFSHSVCLTVSAFCMPCDYRRMYSSRLVITFLARCGLLEKRAYMPFLSLSLSLFAYCSFETSLGILVQFYAAHP